MVGRQVSLGSLHTNETDLRQLKKGDYLHTRTTSLVLGLLALLSVAPLLGACHTTAGAGEDISKAGQAIERSANQHAP